MAGCFLDTCGIRSEIVEIPDFGPGYALYVRFADDSTIECIDGQGLDVKVSIAPGNTIVKGVDGSLFAALPDAQYAAEVGPQNVLAAVPITAALATPVSALLDLSYINTSPTEQMAIIKGQFRYKWAVLREGSAAADNVNRKRSTNIQTDTALPGLPSLSLTAFNAQCVARLKASVTSLSLGAGVGNPAPIIADHFSTSGMVYASNPGQDEDKSEWRDFTFIQPVPAGDTLHLTGDFFYEGPAQSLNVAASSAVVGEYGFAVANCEVFAIPLQVS